MLSQSQCYNVNFNGGTIRVPKYGLYEKQAATQGRPARWLWVEDPRACLGESFTVNWYCPTTGRRGTFMPNTKTSAIARRFQAFARSLPAERLCAPVWPITRDDVAECGPHDRKPQRFILKGRPDYSGRTTEYSVTANCRVGSRILREEGYAHEVMGVR